MSKLIGLCDELSYRSLDIKENIQLLINADLSKKDKELIQKDLPQQVSELIDVVKQLLDELHEQ